MGPRVIKEFQCYSIKSGLEMGKEPFSGPASDEIPCEFS
jgi:hypothetical protein